MVNRNNIDRHLSDIESAHREYAKADSVIHKIKHEAIEKVREVIADPDATKKILEDMMVIVEEKEHIKKWALEEVRNKKQLLIDIIDNIEEPRTYL